MHNYLNIDSSIINSLITLNGKGYTKHYFEGDRRVCSKLGGGFTDRTEDDINDRIKPITGDEYDKLFERQYTGIKETFANCIGTDMEFNLKYDPYKTIMENELGRDEAEPAFYYQGDHLGSSAYLTDDAGAITQTLNYLPYGEDWVDVHNNPNYLSRYKYNGKEKDPESGLHYYGARYYDSDISQWLSIDPMADKYPSLSPYNYCADNPVILVDPDGRDGVCIVDKKKKELTIKAIYYVRANGKALSDGYLRSQWIYSNEEVKNMQKQINATLNEANYSVSEGDYKGYNVKFDLEFIPCSDAVFFAMESFKSKSFIEGFPVSNTMCKMPDERFTALAKKQERQDGKIVGCVGKKLRNIAMNSKRENNRSRIHEVFHTLFFDNDNANSGIGSYTCDDMPNQADINMLINNDRLSKIENVE